MDQIVFKTLEKKRELRQQSANEVKTDMCAAAMPTSSSDQAKPSLGPTILSHAVLFALFATIFLVVLPGFAEILRGMGVPRRSLPKIFLFQSVGGLRSVSGLLLFSLLFVIDVGLCFLVRKIGGRIGLRLWNVAFILGIISIVAIASLALYLPMKRVIAQQHQEELKIDDMSSTKVWPEASGAVAKDPVKTAEERNQTSKANQPETPRPEHSEQVMPSVSKDSQSRNTPAEAMEAILKAARERNARVFQNGFSKSFRASLNEQGHELDDFGDFGNCTFISSNNVDDQRAEVVVEASDGSKRRFTFPMILEDKEWKLHGVGSQGPYIRERVAY